MSEDDGHSTSPNVVYDNTIQQTLQSKDERRGYASAGALTLEETRDGGPRAGGTETDLSKLMQLFIQDRQRLESELADEHRRQQHDMEE